MGGHHDGHPPYVVPSADIYKVEDAPKLVKYRAKLAKEGLTDPWIRNYVWRYDKKYGGIFYRLRRTLGRGLPLGIVAFGITIGIETYLGVDYHPWHHEHKHGSDEHDTQH